LMASSWHIPWRLLPLISRISSPIDKKNISEENMEV
jgi:hypothetical protein